MAATKKKADYLKSLSVRQPQQEGEGQQELLLINGKEEYPYDISEATRPLKALVRSGDYTKHDYISNAVDFSIKKEIGYCIYLACRDKYNLDYDTMDHIMHLVEQAYPEIKSNIITKLQVEQQQAQVQAQQPTTLGPNDPMVEKGQQPDQNNKEQQENRKLYTNKQLSQLKKKT